MIVSIRVILEIPLPLFLLTGYIIICLMPRRVTRTNDTKLAFPVCLHPDEIDNFALIANSMLVITAKQWTLRHTLRHAS